MKTLEEELKIDLYHLHLECQDYGNQYYKYSQAYAHALANKLRKEEQLKLLKQETKTKLEQARASMDLEIRGDSKTFMDKFGIKKLTESTISSMITDYPGYQELVKETNLAIQEKTEEYINAVEAFELALAAMVAIGSKKTNLENAVRLQLGGYYSEPQISDPAISTTRKKGKTTLKERKMKG